MSTLELFDFEGYPLDWGKDDQGNPICEARQLGAILGFSPSYVPEVVSRIYPKFKFQSSMGKPGRPSWYLREPGIYQMIFESKSDLAQRFQCWVFEEVLPKLRADGGYIMPTATSEQIEGLEQKLQSMQKRMAFFGHDKKTVFNMFKILVNHNGMSDELIEAFKPFAGGKRFTIDEFESLIPASVKLPWRDENV
jgi:prophage antirepressor-like protein